jgi:carboxypeptidase C (cathepsin A)
VKVSTGEFAPSRFVSEGSAVLSGNKVDFRVVCEDNVVCDDAGKALGSIFSYSYLRTDGGDAQRPAIFVYNGGPGSSSVWQHLGLFAPRRIKLEDPVNPPVLPPFELEDNPHAPLDVCDVVMIDPVETGYGRLLDPEAGKQFFGIEQDACAMAHFIEGWLTRYGRWDSRIYLAGESYGTLRSCVLASTLMGGPFSSAHRLVGISVAGILMLGAHLHTTGYAAQEPVEPAVLQLPSMAATAWYHRRDAKPELADFVEDAHQFSYEEYLPALFKGSRLGEREMAHVVERLAWFTGIPAAYFREHGLSITTGAFAIELLRDEGRAVGIYDSRYTMKNVQESGVQDPVGDDPAMGQYSPAFVGAMQGPMKRELNITFDREYKAINFAANSAWDNNLQRTPVQHLQAAMRRNRDLRVMFGQGYWDLACPIGQVRYFLSHAGLPGDRVCERLYPSGHMPYLGEESALALAADLREFIR